MSAQGYDRFTLTRPRPDPRACTRCGTLGRRSGHTTHRRGVTRPVLNCPKCGHEFEGEETTTDA